MVVVVRVVAWSAPPLRDPGQLNMFEWLKLTFRVMLHIHNTRYDNNHIHLNL